MLEAFQNQALRLEELSGARIVLQENNNVLQAELEGYKGREEVVKAKPELVERRANSAVADLMQQYKCATSRQRDC